MQPGPVIQKTALLHFLPLELYPPVMNLINGWAAQHPAADQPLRVYSTPCAIKELDVYQAPRPSVEIKRFGSANTRGLVSRLRHYLSYYIKTVVQLIGHRPDTVLYYDTISSFPAWCYKTFFNRSCRVFIHYHEYMSKEEYAGGMRLLRWFHALEMRLYRAAEWVSHTNKERMHFFLADMPSVQIKKKYILPNYPPQSWAIEKKQPICFPVRFIQVGSLGMNSMYTREFAEWIIRQDGQATWDIYALTIESEVMDYLAGLQSPYIRFKGQVNYHELPVILQQYDIGVILYKGHIPNYIYNAPNKLFEYHVSALDAWFPQQMVTASQYATAGSFPRMVPVAFEDLSLYVLKDLVNRDALHYRHDSYTAEQALVEILNKLDNTKPLKAYD